MAKGNKKKNISDHLTKFKSKITELSDISDSEEDWKSKGQAAKKLVQGIFNTTISVNGKLIIHPHLPAVQKRMDNNAKGAPSFVGWKVSQREISNSSSDEELLSLDVEEIFGKKFIRIKIAPKFIDNDRPNLNFEITNSFINKELEAKNNSMFRKKFIQLESK